MVRRAYPRFDPIVPNEMLVPESSEDLLPVHFSPDEKQRLIDNGTYNADGTVNMDTARRFGWDKIWEQRSRLAPEPTP